MRLSPLSFAIVNRYLNGTCQSVRRVAIRIGRLTDSSHRAALITYFDDWLAAHPSHLPNSTLKTRLGTD